VLEIHLTARYLREPHEEYSEQLNDKES